MAKIAVRNLCKRYGDVQALQGLSFACTEGQFFCLLGPAGAGKTTTIKIIAGIEMPDEGDVFVGDQCVTDVPPWDRDIAVAFETYALYPQRTVRENLSFPLRAPKRKEKLSEEEIERRVVEVANLLGIGELLDRLPRQLSGGQRQRVALGRALVRKPAAYLLDEPIAHLDAKLRHRMRGELKRIQRELGVTTIYTTPDQLEALSLADYMAVINEGKVEQVGTPAEVYGSPANVFVARFVGDPPMNILHASLDGQDLLVEGALRLPLPAPMGQALAEKANGKQVLFGIRPKDLRVVSPGSDEAQWQGVVEHVQVLGETSVLTVSGERIGLRVKTATEGAPGRGEGVGIVFDLTSAHFFDAATEARVVLE
ncbi:MAG: ABC transporter ATP-binding protein [Anaerolineae bacterium]|nr:ABC transporter ATP-binding protein [Anaerolineae bacterium]